MHVAVSFLELTISSVFVMFFKLSCLIYRFMVAKCLECVLALRLVLDLAQVLDVLLRKHLVMAADLRVISQQRTPRTRVDLQCQIEGLNLIQLYTGDEGSYRWVRRSLQASRDQVSAGL